jgi:YVTN family beta-propeller protein
LSILCILLVGLVPPACVAMWHCGDIDLGTSPESFLIDPLTGDIFVAADGAFLVRIDEATYGTSTVELCAEATALALDPARGVLYAVHEAADRVTALTIETGDTSLFDVGEGPTALAVDGLRERVFVLNSGDSTISVLEQAAPTDTVRCAGRPSAVAVDPATGMAFAAVGEADLLVRFDPSTGDTACFATGGGPTAIEIDPEKGILYIADTGGNDLSVFVLESDSLFSIALGFAPTGLALNPETGTLYVGGNPQNMAIVDTETYGVTTLMLPDAPLDICIDPLSDRGFAVVPSEGLVVEVAADGDTSIVPLPGVPSSISVNPVTNRCFVADTGRSCISVLDAAHYEKVSVAAGGGPGPIAINLETHKVYTPNYYTKNVTIIDGYTNAKSTLKVADSPNGVLIDPITDDLYVLCAKSAAVVIKRSDEPDTVMASIGEYGHGMALNLNTGMLYVSNRFSRDLSVIDTQTLDTTLVRCGGYPCSVTANMETNMIYVANRTSWTLTVVSGADLTSVFAPVGHNPVLVRHNPATNTVYTVDSGGRSISAVDGTTLERTKIPVCLNPSFLGINANTNTVYVSSRPDGEVTVVDADDLTRRPAKAAVGLGEVEIDQWLNRVFAASWDYDLVSLIDGNFLSSFNIPVGYEPHNSGYDPVLEKLYVTNHAGNSIDIFQLREKIIPRVAVAFDSLAGDVAFSRTPTISGTAASLRTPRNYGIMKVLYKIDNLRGAWQEAAIVGHGSDVAWEFTAPSLLYGSHLVFVTAIDSTACSLSSSSTSSLLRVSDIACYEFTCLSAPPEPPEMVAETEDFGGYLISWTETGGEGGRYDLQISSDPDFTGAVTIGGLRSARYAVSTRRLLQGPCYWRVAAIDYPHGKRSGFSPIYLVGGTEPGDGEDGGIDVLRLAAYPNPSPGSVIISLYGSRSAKALCSVFDVSGRLVGVLDLVPGAGYLSTEWDGTGPRGEALPSGVYYARIHAAGRDLRRKIILVR